MEFDKEELEILEAYEKGEFKPIENLEAEIQMLKTAAHNYLNKNSRINIRIAGTDLNILKRIAAQEGLPYQTLISSVLHKYASGRLQG